MCSSLFTNLLILTPVQSAESEEKLYLVDKPFGDVRTRYNLLEATRTPFTEVPLTEVNKHTFLPARIRREGFIPRVTVVEEFNDNILFNSENIIEDIITIISPGFNFVHKSDRGEMELDYSFESTIYPSHSELNEAFEAHNLLFSGNYQLTKKAVLILSDTFFSFKDATRQTIPGIAARSRVNENYLNALLAYKLTKEIDLLLGYNQVLNDFDDQNATDSLTHDGVLSFASYFTPQDLTEIEYRYRLVDFDQQSRTLDDSTLGNGSGGDGRIHFVSLKNTHEFSQRFSLSAKLGSASISAPISRTDLIANISFKASTKDTTAEISYNRDISTTGGFSTLLTGDTLSTSINSALIKKLYGTLRIDASQFRQINGSGIKIKMLEPSVALEYKLSDEIQFRMSYRYLYQDINIGKIVNEGNKVNLGMIASF